MAMTWQLVGMALFGGLLPWFVFFGGATGTLTAFLLAFIGVKLFFHALHENELPFINGGEHIEWAPTVPTPVSLGAIVVILGVTTIASLMSSKNQSDEERDSHTGPRGH